MDALKRALRAPHVAAVLERMEAVRNGAPTITEFETVQRKTGFRVFELSEQSPVGPSEEPGRFESPVYFARQMRGRGTSFQMAVDGKLGAPSWCVGNCVTISVPKPMNCADYLSLGKRDIKMDLGTTSYLLPPWDKGHEDEKYWLVDGVYFGEHGRVIHVNIKGERATWVPGDPVEENRGQNFHSSRFNKELMGSPDRGVRYAFEFMVERSN